jgi:L-ascorbate 6-phosphate lactonase
MQKVNHFFQNQVLSTPLGQAGFLFEFNQSKVYVDPYLSDRVAELHGDDLGRLIAPPMKATEIRNADYVLITHIHPDHCDPDTLLPISEASQQCVFIGPNEVVQFLWKMGLENQRTIIAKEDWIVMAPHLRVMPVPAAHPSVERDHNNLLRCIGYIIEYHGKKIYHAGDTSPDKQVLKRIGELLPIDIAFLPVNERNYYRDRRGILGNMSVREAFQMAGDIGAKILVPMHWDLFAPNSVFPEEIQLLYDKIRPPFQLLINPVKI